MLLNPTTKGTFKFDKRIHPLTSFFQGFKPHHTLNHILQSSSMDQVCSLFFSVFIYRLLAESLHVSARHAMYCYFQNKLDYSEIILHELHCGTHFRTVFMKKEISFMQFKIVDFFFSICSSICIWMDRGDYQYSRNIRPMYFKLILRDFIPSIIILCLTFIWG